jgi:hypothetical protein
MVARRANEPVERQSIAHRSGVEKVFHGKNGRRPLAAMDEAIGETPYEVLPDER